MEDQSSKNRREHKRPTIALYRPGVSRLSRRTSPGTHSDQSEESSSGTEISPPKSVRPVASLVVERSSQSEVRTGTTDTFTSKVTGKNDSSNVKAGSKEADKGRVKESHQQSSGTRPKHKNISISEDWDKDISAPAQPARVVKHVSGASRDVADTSTHHDARKRNQQGGKITKLNEQSKKDTRGRGEKVLKDKTSTQAPKPKEQPKTVINQNTKPAAKHDNQARGQDQLKRQVDQKISAVSSTHHDPRPRGQQGKPSNRRKEPPDKHNRGSTRKDQDKSIRETNIDTSVHNDTKQTKQPMKTSKRQDQQAYRDARGSTHTEQLRVDIGGEVNEPAEISPTTVELIKTWKGDQTEVVITNRPPKETVTSKITQDGSVSISKGKGPLRSENKPPIPSLMDLNFPDSQRHQLDLKRTQTKIERPGNTDVPKELSGNKLDEQQMRSLGEKMGKLETGVHDNAAEWDWVKELMNEEPPAEPLFYHGKDTADNTEDNITSQVIESHLNKHADYEHNDILPTPEISTSQESKKETPILGKTDRYAERDLHSAAKDDKQRIPSAGRVSREARGQRDDERVDQIKVDHGQTSRAEAVAPKSKRDGKKYSASRNSAKQEDMERPHDTYSKHKERHHDDPCNKMSESQRESYTQQRPEKAIYVAPKVRNDPDQRHEIDGQRHHYEDPQRSGDTFEDDEREDIDITSREVEVSPNKSDIIITVKNQSKKTLHKQDSGRNSKRYSSHRSRQRGTSESSTGSESHLVDVSVKREREFVKETRGKLSKLHIDHTESKSLSESMAIGGSNREKSRKGANRRTRHTYDDDDKEEDRSFQRKNMHDSQGASSRAESDRSHEHRRKESRKSKHSVQFSKEVHQRSHSSGDSGSDSGGYRRSQNRDYQSKSDHRDRETRRKPRDSKRPMDESQQHHAKGGGLLRLPGNIHVENVPRSIPPRTDMQPSDQSAYSPCYDKHYPVHGQSPSSTTDSRHMHRSSVQNPSQSTATEVRHKQDGSRSRGADKSRLWDPSKPQQRPALPDKQSETDELQFYDPDEEHSDNANSLDQRNPYPYPYPQGYAPQGYYPGYPPVPQHYYSQGYYPPQQPQPPPQSTSWAEQVENQRMPKTPPPGAYSAAAGPSYGHFPPLSAAATSDPYQLATHQDVQGGPPQPSVHHQSAMRLLREASGMDLELTNLLSRGLRGNEYIDRAISIQHDLEKVCEKVLLLDLDACNKYNMEQLLWKSAYYQLIEALRKQQDPIGVNKEYLMRLLDHGNDFYQGLLTKLESNYKFNLENYTGMDPLRDEKRRSVKLALLSAQRCMIALGDIARYKELANDTSNYGKARSWYLKAQQLVPRNGRPYNQLAILALYTRRKLDSVYYYMRSLAASNQFLTARESLMSLFEEVRKKSQHKEKEELRVRWEKEQAKTLARRKKARQFLQRGEDQWREEIWVSHDGVRSDADGLIQDKVEEDSEETKLKKMSPVEVNKKFVLSFLNAHGKIFTNIGMEAFPHVVDKLLQEFYVLLTHSPPPISSTRLLQLMAINMYAAHHTARQEPEAENMRSLQQEQAVQLGLDMFGLLVERCTRLFKEHITQHPSETHLLNEDLHEFLPGIKVYADWMMCHMALWNPPPNCTEMPYSAAVDVWKVLADFFNAMDSINTSAVSFIKHQPEDCLEIRLPEDLALSGFVPLMTLPLQPVYVPAGTDKIVAMDCTRINSLRFFAEFLCGLELPLLAYRKSKGGFFSVAPEYLHADPEADVVEEMDEDDDVIIEDYTEEDDDGESTEADRDINRLRERKVDLERKLKQQQRKKEQREAIMDSHRQKRKMEIEIRPVYLIPDTNCFIDHVTIIQMLVSCKRFTLVVPLVVINELDGLAKGNREGQYKDPVHAYQVKSCAASAMRYLEDQFELGNKHVRALTGKGTVMDTIMFRSEESGNKGNNDDLILKCCLHYCEDKARDFMPHDKDAPVHLLREVVLLTNDRNLRVKAHNQNVPVKDVISFVKWAKL